MSFLKSETYLTGQQISRCCWNKHAQTVFTKATGWILPYRQLLTYTLILSSDQNPDIKNGTFHWGYPAKGVDFSPSSHSTDATLISLSFIYRFYIRLRVKMMTLLITHFLSPFCQLGPNIFCACSHTRSKESGQVRRGSVQQFVTRFFFTVGSCWTPPNHPLSAVHDCSCNIYAAALLIWRHFFQRQHQKAPCHGDKTQQTPLNQTSQCSSLHSWWLKRQERFAARLRNAMILKETIVMWRVYQLVERQLPPNGLPNQ
jgi:hypothetical protein